MRILLLTPSTFGYEARVSEAFERIGNEVEWIDERVGNSVLAKAATRLGLLRLVPSLIERHVNHIIRRAKALDVQRIIAVNPETLKGADFARLKAALPNVPIIIYRWDSLAQKPIDEETFVHADAVYSFDVRDCESDQRLRHLPLFHNHTALPQGREREEAKYSLSFVGTAQMRRIEVLGRLCRTLDASDRKYLFFLKTQSSVHHAIFWLAARFYGYRGQMSRKAMPYADLLEVIAQSGAVVDIEFKRQSGLTMRTFEVIFSGMPLVTTNPVIARYEFFPSVAVSIFDDTQTDLPEISQEHSGGAQEYFDKYFIDQWARTLLEMRNDGYLLDRKATER